MIGEGDAGTRGQPARHSSGEGANRNSGRSMGGSDAEKWKEANPGANHSEQTRQRGAARRGSVDGNP